MPLGSWAYFSSPLPISRPASFRLGLLIDFRIASLFDVPRGLAAQGRTSVLIYYVLATLFASPTFFSIFITPLIYSIKSPNLKICRIIFLGFKNRVPKNLGFLLWCLESIGEVFLASDVSFRYFFLHFLSFLPKLPSAPFPLDLEVGQPSKASWDHHSRSLKSLLSLRSLFLSIITTPSAWSWKK